MRVQPGPGLRVVGGGVKGLEKSVGGGGKRCTVEREELQVISLWFACLSLDLSWKNKLSLSMLIGIVLNSPSKFYFHPSHPPTSLLPFFSSPLPLRWLHWLKVTRALIKYEALVTCRTDPASVLAHLVHPPGVWLPSASLEGSDRSPRGVRH